MGVVGAAIKGFGKALKVGKRNKASADMFKKAMNKGVVDRNVQSKEVFKITKGLKRDKKVAGTIKSVAPNVPKTDMQKALRTFKVEGHKFKASMAKTSSDVFHKTQEITKKLDKIKTTLARNKESKKVFEKAKGK